MMDILFLGSKAQILRCLDLITGIECFDIASDLSWDKAFELTNEEDFDGMVIDLASIEYEDAFFDIFSKSRDMSSLIERFLKRL